MRVGPSPEHAANMPPKPTSTVDASRAEYGRLCITDIRAKDEEHTKEKFGLLSPEVQKESKKVAHQGKLLPHFTSLENPDHSFTAAKVAKKKK